MPGARPPRVSFLIIHSPCRRRSRVIGPLRACWKTFAIAFSNNLPEVHWLIVFWSSEEPGANWLYAAWNALPPTVSLAWYGALPVPRNTPSLRKFGSRAASADTESAEVADGGAYPSARQDRANRASPEPSRAT